MKSLHFFLLWLGLPLWLQATDPVKEISTKIAAVTVFQQGAQLIHKGEAYIPAGRSLLKFTGLSAQLNAQSLQFSATGNFTILSVNHQVNYLTAPIPNEKITQLQKIQDRFNKDLRTEQALLQVYQEEENLLLTNKEIGGQQNGVPIDNLKATAAYFRERLTEVKMEKLSISDRITILQDTINRLQLQLQQLRSPGGQQAVSEVLVAIDAEQAGNSSFVLEYFMAQAGWFPLYDLRAESIDKPVQLKYKAKVYQQSGINWDKVAIKLSTGQPAQQQVFPVLYPWWLQLYTQPGYNLNGLDARAERATDDEKMFNEVQVSSYAAPPSVQVEDRATSIEFVIDIPYDIPTDGQHYVVQIATESLPASYEYYCAPKLNQAAFLTARLTNWEQYNLLPGEANLFFEGTYLGKTQINPQATGDTLAISLGKDNNIVVKRTKDTQYKDKAFIGGKQTTTIGWTIELRNKKRQGIHIIVEDQYPISTTDQIEVELVKHKSAKVKKEEGKLRWELDMKPGESQTLGFAYEVKYDKKLPVVLE
ncbi:MAG TPA: DUF4139 domain-containing protein [Saprospiraceae bacterium]|nr:DUF4139 domain-containing protein [Saprospiraceae bacterium]HMQ81596.1 DUF4139 domain-containing protein [Saprospiraceae bacterium]